MIFRTPPNCLTSETHYEKMLEMFGRKGHFCTTVKDIQQALKICLQVNIIFHLIFIKISNFNRKITLLQITDSPSLLNIMINPQADRKQQKFTWLTESKL